MVATSGVTFTKFFTQIAELVFLQNHVSRYLTFTHTRLFYKIVLLQKPTNTLLFTLPLLNSTPYTRTRKSSTIINNLPQSIKFTINASLFSTFTPLWAAFLAYFSASIILIYNNAKIT